MYKVIIKYIQCPNIYIWIFMDTFVLFNLLFVNLQIYLIFICISSFVYLHLYFVFLQIFYFNKSNYLLYEMSLQTSYIQVLD